MRYLLFFILLVVTNQGKAQSKQEAAIRDLLFRQTQAWNKGDLEGFMETYWKNDSLLFIGKERVTRGWQNTLESYKRSYPGKEAMGALSFDIIQIKKLSANQYFVVGKWMLKRTKDEMSGHSSLLLKRINRKWKIIEDHSS